MTRFPSDARATKPRWSLLPWGALGDVLGAFEHGARKYAVGDWVNYAPVDHIDAAFRHLTAWLQLEPSDPETGLSHLAHAGARVLMALAVEKAVTSKGQERAA
jgi:hypothetical protein